MKKLLLTLLTITLIFSGCSNSQSSSIENTESVTDESSVIEEPKTVSITMSSSLLKELDVTADDYVNGLTEEDMENFISITANEDGSVTLVMDAKKNKEFMKEYAKDLEAQIQEIINDNETWANIIDVKHNDNFSKFTVTLESGELNLMDAFSAIIFYMAGGMYQTFSGVDSSSIDVQIDYVDKAGNIIESGKMSDSEE